MPHEPKVGELPALTREQEADCNHIAYVTPRGDDDLLWATSVAERAMRECIAAEREARKDEARDAARYRWLREQNWFSGPLAVLRDPKRVLTRGSGLGADCPSGDRLDAAIDALQAEQPEGSNANPS